MLFSDNMLFAQLSAPQPKFHNFTVENGLPSSETYFVHQDHAGYIWICTDRGVSRYDGYQFHNFTTTDGLTDNLVFRIFEDSKHRIWFVTSNSQLCYYEGGRIKSYKYNHVIAGIKEASMIAFKTIYVDTKDNLYLSIHEKGLFQITSQGRLIVNEGIKNSMLTIIKKENVYLWINRLPYGELHAERPHPMALKLGDKLSHFGKTPATNRFTISSGDFNHFLLAGNDVFSIKSLQKVCTEPNAIAISSYGNSLWTGTYKKGVRHISDIGKPNQSENRYLNGFSISSILKDREGGFWFTSLENGIFYTPGLYIKSYTVNEGLMDNTVHSITGIGPDIYTGFLVGRWQQLQYPYKKQEKALVASHTSLGASDHQIYFSNTGTYTIIRGKPKKIDINWRREFFREPHSVVCVTSGITRFYDDGRTEDLYLFTEDKSPHKQRKFSALLVKPGNIIWAGNEDGMYFIENKQLRLAGKNPLFKAKISDLAYHAQWQNIAATRGEGIFFFENDKVILQLKQELLSDQVNCVVTDHKGGIWVGTNKGLNYISRNNQGTIQVKSYTTLHGLYSNEISCLYVWKDLVWVGTKLGLSVIDTQKQPKISSDSRIYLEYIRSAGKDSISAKEKVIFDYDESYIKIGFRTCNYRKLDQRNYQYRFNAKSAWISTPIPEILLTSPISGDYILEVKYENEDGTWSTPETICTFTISPPFYNRWYFYLAITVAMGLLFFGIFRYRVRQLNQRHFFHSRITQLEQKALNAQMNPHFIFNALNSIQSFLIYEENDKAEKYLLKFAQLIRQTLISSRESSITIDKEIEILKQYMDLEAMRFQDRFDYKIHNNLAPGELQLKIPNMLIQPFVENSILHGFSTIESGGRINIYFDRTEEFQVRCIIEDNGIGRKKSMRKKPSSHVSLGMTITQERLRSFETKQRINLHMETLDIENEDGSTGTKVIINLPILE